MDRKIINDFSVIYQIKILNTVLFVGYNFSIDRIYFTSFKTIHFIFRLKLF